MAIMLLLMGMTVGAYYGFMRGAAMQSAITNLKSSLSLARQFAVTRRCKTNVLFWQDGTNSHYVVCMEDGRSISSSGTLRINPPKASWGNGGLTGSDIYNLTTQEYGLIYTNSTYELIATNAAHPNILNGMPWSVGDKYGWAIRSQTHLPEGMVFGNESSPPYGRPVDAPKRVIFNPDGTAPLDTIVIKVAEKDGLLGSRPVKLITVQGLTGKATVSDGTPW